MVCRENKGRSAQMGIVKALQRQMAGTAFNDAEVQSLIHQVKHDGDALDQEAPVTQEEQINLMRRLRAQVESMDGISESEKYRESRQRPGIVTRINQEIQRLESGKNERGETLTVDQMNSHSHIYAMQRLANTLERVSPAKEQFLETNARHRGISYEQAKGEWNELMNRSGNFTRKSGVRDDVRESLATAGVETHTQVNLGVSGKAIDSMEIMEERRRQAVANLPSRPATTDADAMGTFVSPDSPQAKLKCDTCGQFGHEASACPNEKEAAQLDCIRADRVRIGNASELTYQEGLARNASDEFLAEQTDDPAQFRKDAFAAVEAAKRNGTYISHEDQLKMSRRLDREEQRVERAMAANHVVISDTVAGVRYNPDSGVLVIDRPNAPDGSPQPSIVRRAQPDEAADVAERLREESLDQVMATSVNQERHRFANTADAEAALTLHRCPSCGQWASMSSGHQCPIEGGPSEQQEHDRRRRRIEAQRERRRRLADGGEDVALLEPELVANKHVRKPKQVPVPNSEDGETLQLTHSAFGVPRKVIDSAESGNVATFHPHMDYPDGQVTGKVSVWKDTDRDELVMSIADTGAEESGLRCNCADYQTNGRCKHIYASAGELSRIYRTTLHVDNFERHRRNEELGTERIDFARPGVLPGEDRSRDRVAPDGLEISEQRYSVSDLVTMKDYRREAEMEQYRQARADGQGATTLMVQGPTDGEGQAIDWPETWSPQEARDDGGERKAGSLNKVTDLTDNNAVADRLRFLMSNRSITMPDGTKEMVKFGANQKQQPGGISITIPKKYRNATASRRSAVRRGLAEALGVSPNAVTDDGVFINKDTATYAEFLDRAAQNVNSRRYNGPRATATANREDYNRARAAAARNFRDEQPIV